VKIHHRFVVAGFHYGPGDEAFLLQNAALTDVSLPSLVAAGHIDRVDGPLGVEEPPPAPKFILQGALAQEPPTTL